MKFFFDQILERLKMACNLKTDTALAEYIGVTPQVLSNWKVRNNPNLTEVLKKIENVNFHWLLTGQYANVTSEQHVRVIETHRDLLNLMIEKMVDLQSGLTADPDKAKNEIAILKRASELLETLEKQ